MTAVIRAVFFDFGGVILSSPFDAFASFEQRSGLPPGFVRRLNATNPDDNAWAQLERSEVDLDGFVALFEQEALEQGHALDGRAVLACLAGELRPRMVDTLVRCHDRYRTALLTNNFIAASSDSPHASVLEHFDVVVESAKVGVRKPDRRFYEIACELAAVGPEEVVFLDDLGINLKPAREMGMTTIKVVDPDVAIDELWAVLGRPARQL